MAPTAEPNRSSNNLEWRLGGTPHFVIEALPLDFERERVLYGQPAGPNPLYHRDD